MLLEGWEKANRTTTSTAVIARLKLKVGARCTPGWRAFFCAIATEGTCPSGSVDIYVPALASTLRTPEALVQMEWGGENLTHWLTRAPEGVDEVGDNAQFQRVDVEEIDSRNAWDGRWVGAQGIPLQQTQLKHLATGLSDYLVSHAWCTVREPTTAPRRRSPTPESKAARFQPPPPQAAPIPSWLVEEEDVNLEERHREAAGSHLWRGSNSTPTAEKRYTTASTVGDAKRRGADAEAGGRRHTHTWGAAVSKQMCVRHRPLACFRCRPHIQWQQESSRGVSLGGGARGPLSRTSALGSAGALGKSLVSGSLTSTSSGTRKKPTKTQPAKQPCRPSRRRWQPYPRSSMPSMVCAGPTRITDYRKRALGAVRRADELDIYMARGCDTLTVEVCPTIAGKELFHALKRTCTHRRVLLQRIRWPTAVTNRMAYGIATTTLCATTTSSMHPVERR